MSREEAYVALFERLQDLRAQGLVRLCDRRVRYLEELAASELPALFLAVDHNEITPQAGLPPKRVLGARVFLYAGHPDRHTPAGTVLNGLIDAVEAALAPDPAEDCQTLLGRVRHAWIEGEIQVFEGPAGERAVAIVPVRLLVP